MSLKLALSVSPSQAPSVVPSQAPSLVPSQAPSVVPSQAPSVVPSQARSASPASSQNSGHKKRAVGTAKSALTSKKARCGGGAAMERESSRAQTGIAF